MPAFERRRRGPFLGLALSLLVLVAAGCEPEPTRPDPDPPGPAPVTEVRLSQDSVRLVPEDTLALTAETRGAQGQLLTGRDVSWSTSDAGIVSVDGGQLIGVSPGTATVTARSEGREGVARIVVTEVILAANTIEADSVLTLVSDSAEVASGTLRYNARSGPVDVEVGDILLGATNEGGGYLKRVTSVQADGGTVAVQTEDATFIEATDSAAVDITVDETVQGALRQAFAEGRLGELGLPEGMSVNRDGSISMIRLPINFSFNQSVTPRPGAQVSAEVTGNFAIVTGSDAIPGTSTFKFKYRHTAGIPKRFRIETTAGVEMNTNVTARITGDIADLVGLDATRDLLRFQIFPASGCAWKGPVCYAVFAVVEAYIDVTAQASAVMSQSTYLGAGVARSGVDWKRGRGWSQLGGPYFTFDFSEPSFSAEGVAGFRFGMRPNLELELYKGLANASAGVDGYVEAKLTVNPWEWRGDVGLGLDFFTRGELTFWGLTDTSAEFVYPDLWTHTFADPAGALVRAEASPSVVNVGIGETARVGATAISLLTNSGIGLTPAMTWEIAQGGEAIASINNDGVITGLGQGQTSFRGRIRDARTDIFTQVGTINVGRQLSLEVLPPGRSTVFSGSSVNFQATVTAGGQPVPGATVQIFNGLRNTTAQRTTDANGRFFYSPDFTAALANGVYEVRFGPVTADGFPTLTTPVVREVEKTDPPRALRIGTCLSLTGTLCASEGTTIEPGQSFYVLFGADNVATDQAMCGATMAVVDPIAGTTTSYTTEGNCLGAHFVSTTADTPPAVYTFTVGPATLAGFADGPATTLEVVVTRSSGTPPTVTGFAPGGAGVSIDSPVTVTFSEPMNPATFSAIAVESLGPGGSPTPVAGSWTESEGGRTARFTPASPLPEFLSTIRITVPTSVRDAEGDPVASTAQHTFSTEFVSEGFLYYLIDPATGLALDTPQIGSSKTCEMRERGPFTGQYWYFTFRETNQGVDYRWMRTAFGGDNEYLEGADEPGRCFLTGGGDFSGQLWNLEAQQAGTGLVVLRPLSHRGSGKTLAVDGIAPMMTSTVKVWELQRRQRR